MDSAVLAFKEKLRYEGGARPCPFFSDGVEIGRQPRGDLSRIIGNPLDFFSDEYP